MNYNTAIRTRVEFITPENAAEYLKLNTNNFRKINKSVVTAYANDMKAGKWVLNGEAIVFGKSGKLLNGQHRLRAVVESGVAVPFLIVENVDDDTDSDGKSSILYDFGLNRSVASHVQIKNSTIVVGVASLILSEFTNKRTSKGILIEYTRNHEEEINRAVSIANHGCNGSRMCKKSSFVAVLHCMIKFGLINEEDGIKFCTIANSGNAVGIDRSPSPALVFRRQVARLMGSGGKNAQLFIGEIAYKALIDFVKRKERMKDYKTEPGYVKELIRKLNVMEGNNGI